MTAEAHRRQEAAPQRRQIREVANGATDGGAPRRVLTPDVIHGLARNRDPTARFAGDIDHASRVRLGSAIRPDPARSSGSFEKDWPRRGLRLRIGREPGTT